MYKKSSRKGTIEKEVNDLLKELQGRECCDENIINRLRHKYKDGDLLEQIQEAYTEITRDNRKRAKKFAKIVLQKYGLQYPLHILLEKALRYKSRFNLNDAEFDIFKKIYESYILGNTETKEKKLYVPFTNMTKVLGRSDRYGEKLQYSAHEAKYLDEILRSYQENKPLHSQISLQSMTYPSKGFSASSISGTANRQRTIPEDHVHPLLAALFIPKFKLLDEHILLSSIPRIINERKNNRPLVTRPDYELFYDLITSPTDMACSVDSPMYDLELRSQLQATIWRSVLGLRYGKYYDPSYKEFLIATNNCHLTEENTPNKNFLDFGDEGALLRKVLNSFAIRPTIIRTTSLNYEIDYPLRPQNTMQDFRVEATPLLVLRLGRQHVNNVPEIIVQGQGITAKSVNENNDNTMNIKDVLESKQNFFDRELRMILPKVSQVIYSKSLLIINVPRKSNILDYSNLLKPIYEWNGAPATHVNISKMNNTKVIVPFEFPAGNNKYYLQSAIKLNTSTLGSSKKDGHEYIVGLSTLLIKDNNDDDTSNPDYMIYDPLAINTVIPGSTDGNVEFESVMSGLRRKPNSEYDDIETTLQNYSSLFFYKTDSDERPNMIVQN